MECRERLQNMYRLALAERERMQLNIDLEFLVRRQRRRARRGQRRRCAWTRGWIGRRQQFGVYDQLMVELRREDPTTFNNFVRMPPVMYDEILARVEYRITKQHTRYREALDPGLKLAVCLRHLASGAKYAELQYGWRIPKNTISIVVREVCQAICDEYMDEVMTPPTTPEEWQAIAEGFLNRWNFPHTIGALDGKHVAIRCPAKSGSLYYNYKGFYSIILMALVDSDYKFIWADLGGKGAASDAQIYNASELKACMDDGILNLPDPSPLPNDTQDIPYFIIADDAFGLKPSLMKPYGGRGRTVEERIFNYRLSRARRCVENAFGILANRFQVLLTTMGHSPSTVRLIVKTCMVLHNLMRIRYPQIQNQLIQHHGANCAQAGQWRAARNLEDTLRAVGPNCASRDGKKQRNLIRHWCNCDAGSVPWQNTKI